MTNPDAIKTFRVGMLPTQCYLLNGQYLVDPGGMNQKLKNTLKEIGGIDAILLTHAHWDHIDGIQSVREIIGATPIFCHSQEKQVLQNPDKNYSSIQGSGIRFEPDGFLENIDLFIQDSELQIIHTPGHTQGSVSIYWPENGSVLSGDLLFKGGVGRTDLPGGNQETLLSSIQNLVETIPESTEVFPGHGPKTTLKEEMETNPYLKMI